jgi:hypothetical protein
MCSVIDPPLLSIVTINFMATKILVMIDSIKRHIHSVAMKIIVVDNARGNRRRTHKINYPWVSVYL